MKRYFLHVRQQGDLIIDEEGMLQSNLSAVRSKAIEGARDMIASDIQSGMIDLEQSVVIADEDGQELEEITFFSVMVSEGTRTAGEKEAWLPASDRTPSREMPPAMGAVNEAGPGLDNGHTSI